MSEKDTSRPGGEIVVFQAEDGGSRIRVLLAGETVWLTQALIAELFQTSVPNVNIHLKNIYAEGELAEAATVKEYLIVRREGPRQVSRNVLHYNLEAILAVGYRVQSPRGTQFRQWATERLREYIVKGFTLDDERLKGGSGQNKMHHAATGMTAAEIVRRRAAAGAPNMGLTAWKGGRVIKRDVGTAKNYFDAKEIDTLNRITVMFLDQAEFRAQRRRDIHMRDWEAFLDKFLRDTELPVLAGAGSVSHDAALDWAERQYAAFAERRILEAEETAENRYVDDLRASADTLEQQRKKLPPKKGTQGRKKGSKPGPGKGGGR